MSVHHLIPFVVLTTLVYSDSEKCELLNDHFASVFTQEDLSSVHSFYVLQIADPLADIEFTPQDVYVKLSTLNPSKASRPDGWLILFLKECGQQLSVPLSILFSKSFNSSTLPDAWKEALITPIYLRKVIALLQANQSYLSHC